MSSTSKSPYVVFNLNFLILINAERDRLIAAGLIYQPEPEEPAMFYVESDDVRDGGAARFKAVCEWVKEKGSFEAIPAYAS